MKAVTLNKKVPLNLIISTNNNIELYNCFLTFSLVTETDNKSEDALRKAQIDQNISFSKVVTFLENILNNSIVIDREDKFINTWSSLDNNIMVLPDVSDTMLIACLHAKLNSLICENSCIDTVQLFDITENMTFDYFNDGDPYSELPLDEEWCPELSFWETPWWFRDDVVTFDKIAEDSTSYSKWIDSNERAEIIGLSTEIFNEIEKQFTQEITNIGLGEIIEVDFSKKFKPTLVD